MTARSATARPERILAFRRGDRVLGIEGRYSREVTALASLTPVPLAPRALLGVGNLRGTLLPVIDLAPLLGLAAEPWASPMPVHVATADGITTAIAIDEVAGFEPWPAAEPLPVEPGEPAPLRSVARGSLPFRGGRVIFLDLPAVLRLARDRFAGGDAPTPS
jgi:chemotaxis signal transduction protein